MKSKKSTLIIICVLLVLTAALAVIHLNTRNKTPDGALAIVADSKTAYVTLDSLKAEPVSGTVINGKGEEKSIDGSGVLLVSLLPESAAEACVFAGDEYSAQIPAEDFDRAWLLLQEDGSLRLIVFGDENSKRDVKNVVRIEAR